MKAEARNRRTARSEPPASAAALAVLAGQFRQRLAAAVAARHSPALEQLRDEDWDPLDAAHARLESGELEW